MKAVSIVDLALERAAKAHAGQTDRGGQPYILHPIRIMARMADDKARAAALLHDVLEDTDATAEDLLADGIPADVVQAVQLLTKAEGEAYADFILRLRDNDLARRVKIADLEDNLNLDRLPVIGQADLERCEKYKAALRVLGVEG